MIKVLFVGDVIGKPGREAASNLLPSIKKEYDIDFTVINGENSAGGFGITSETYRKLISYGADAVTTGNHIWDKREIQPYLEIEENLFRPANFPPGNKGKGHGICVIEKDDKEIKIGILNLIGRVFMTPVDCPFQAADRILEELRKETNVIIVDIHAEATSEKQAMGHYLDGRVSFVTGTHTHVQTSDERILAGGTAFITDAGMTGPFDSIIGDKKEIILHKFLTSTPIRFEVAKDDIHLNGVVVSINEETGKATDIKRLDIKYEKK